MTFYRPVCDLKMEYYKVPLKNQEEISGYFRNMVVGCGGLKAKECKKGPNMFKYT